MFAIAPYAIELLDEQREQVDLWDFNKNNNLRQVLIDYYVQELDTYRTMGGKRLFRVSELFSATDISVAGKYETGEHGLRSTIYDVEQRAISHEKGISEADMFPFIFSFVLPKSDQISKRKKGILLLSRTKNFGIRTLTIPHLKTYIEARFSGYHFDIKRVFPAALARTLLDQGTLKAIHLIKYRVPSSLEDFLDQEDRASIQTVEVVLKARAKGSFLSKARFQKLLSGKGTFRELYESADMACDNVKLDIEIGGKLRRIDIGKQRVSSNIDVTDDIEVDDTGFPSLGSWFAKADEIAVSLLGTMDITIDLQTSVRPMPVPVADPSRVEQEITTIG
jgi:hypothetical protein